MPQNLVGLELDEIRDVLGPEQPEFRAKQVFHALYGENVAELVQILTLPATLRRTLAEHHTVGGPELAGRYESVDGTRRYLLRLEGQRTIETVVMPDEGRE